MNLNIISGPTSTGKTSLALTICKEYGGVIISADSRQIYKEMDIGTGKIPINNSSKYKKFDTYWTLDGIEVFGYDLVSPNEYFSAYDYTLFAIEKINHLSKEYENVFLVGGTGFYIDLVTGYRKIEGGNPNFELRNRLEMKSIKELQESLKEKNIKRFNDIDINNKYRLVRALEIENNKNNAIDNKKLPKLNRKKLNYLGLTSTREELYNRADLWAEKIWDNGLIEETNSLISKYPSSVKLDGIVYKCSKAYLENKITKIEAIQKTKYDLHAYIRRQQTWLKKDKRINWLEINDLDIKNKALKHFNIV